MHEIGFRRWAAVALLGLLVGGAHGSSAATQSNEAALRAALEGSWVLEEFHLDGEVLRPPAIGGRWTLHDGIVMAHFHRSSGDSYESFSAYGRYELDAENSTWSYGYERIQTASGPSAEAAVVQVTTGTNLIAYTIRREGDVLVLERPNDRREYEGPMFRYLPGGSLLRQYRKVE